MAPRIPLPVCVWGRNLMRKVEGGRVFNPKPLNMGFIHWFCSEQLGVLHVEGKKRERMSKLAFIGRRGTTMGTSHGLLLNSLQPSHEPEITPPVLQVGT